MSGGSWNYVKGSENKKKKPTGGRGGGGGGDGGPPRGGRGARGGGSSPFDAGAPTYKDVSLSIFRDLYLVVLYDKIRSRFPSTTFSVSEEEKGPDHRGNPLSEFTFRARGPQGTEAFELLRQYDRKKAEIFLSTDEYDWHRIRQRAFEAPKQIGTIVSTSPGGESMTRVRFSTVLLPGESYDEMNFIESVKSFLTVEQAGQQFGRSHHRGGQEEVPPPNRSTRHHADPQGHQVVAGRNAHGNRRGLGQGGAQLAVEWERELKHADSLDPAHARGYLERLVHEKASAGTERDMLPWLAFLYKVESRFVLAELAGFELSGAKLTLSGEVRHLGKIKIDLGHGIPPFTERRPSVMCDDDVLLRCWGTNEQFRCPIYTVLPDEVSVMIDTQKPFNLTKQQRFTDKEREKAAAALLLNIRDGRLFDVVFDSAPYSRQCDIYGNACLKGFSAFDFLQTPDPNIRRVQSLEQELSGRGRGQQEGGDRGRGRGGGSRTARGGRFFQGGQPVRHQQYEEDEEFDPFDGLSDMQRKAAQFIVHGPSNLRKIYVEGPCGTGKTETICRSVVALLANPHNRVLLLAPSHSAGDVLGVRLLGLLGDCPEERFMRVYPPGRHPLRCPEMLFPYTNFLPGDAGHKEFSKIKSSDRFNVSRLAEMMTTQQVVVAGLTQASMIWRNAEGRPFTHVFIDEVAQASIAIGLQGLIGPCDLPHIKFVFSGDENQIGPQCFAKCAQQWLKQTMNRYLKTTAVVVKLDVSYRQVPALAELQSFLFYNGRLKAVGIGNQASLDVKEWTGLRGNPHPMRFIHTGKHEQRLKTSYVNKQESRVIINCVLSLHSELNIPLRDMVIFTQYKEQKRLIVQDLHRQGAAGSGRDSVQVHEIEDFHGDERKVILISLCRSSEDEQAFDRRRLNTAMGRAGSLCIVVGDGEMLVESNHKPARELISRLVEEQLVDGYDYDKKRFDESKWKPLTVKPVVKMNLKASASLPTARDLREGRFLRLSKDEVLANQMQYFVGVVSGFNSWEDEASMYVRHRMISGNDVLLDEQTTVGQRKDFIFDGDVVAVRIDERQSRWPVTTYVRSKTAEVMIPQPDITVNMDVNKDVVTLEDFEQCLPQILEDCHNKPLVPTGDVVAMLLQPDLPPFVGHIQPDWEFAPVNNRFPKLIMDQRPKGMKIGDFVVCRLIRSGQREPHYAYQGPAPSPFSLGEVLRLHTPRLPNGSQRNQYPMETLTTEDCVIHNAFGITGCRNAYRAQHDDETGALYIACYIPLVCDVMASDRTGRMEQEAASRGTTIWQKGIEGVCDRSRIEMTDMGDKDAFPNSSMAGGHEKIHKALMIRFPCPKSTEHVPFEKLAESEVEVVALRCFPLETKDNHEFDLLSIAASQMNDSRACGCGVASDGASIQSQPVHIAAEIDNWTNFTAAVLLSRTLPYHSLLVRHDAPQCDVRRSVRGDPIHRHERPEYWVPTRVPLSRGLHHGTGFPVYAMIASPWERYGDVLTQRLLLTAMKFRRCDTGRPNVTKAEQELAANIRLHANWLNTIPLVYGDQRNN